MLNTRNDVTAASDPAMPDRHETPAPPTISPWRFLPLGLLLAGLGAFFALGLDAYVSFEALRTHREEIVAWVAANRPLAVIVYTLGYVALVAFSLPGAALATMLGGFLFGTVLATASVVIGATAGATVLFLAARTAFAELLHARAGPALEKMERGFRENALSYLLFLRLVPIFPFVLVNLVPAFLGVSLRVFIVGTLVGIIPGTAIYASLGSSIGNVLDEGSMPDLDIVMEPRILLPLLALATLALAPVLLKKLRRRRS